MEAEAAPLEGPGVEAPGVPGRLAWTLTLVRVWTGLILVYTSISKLEAGPDWRGRMLGFLNGQDQTFGFYQPFLEHVVIPHAGVFAIMTAWGELLLGVALVLGLATRLSASFVVLMMLSYYLAKGAVPISPLNDILMILCMLPLIAAPGGRVGGVDGWLARRGPAWASRWIW